MLELLIKEQPGLFLGYITLIGVCVGSFLNVVIIRFSVDESIGGRSRCPKCRHEIAWYDNIPLLSYAILRGRCRFCKEGISARYPLVELLMAMLSAALWLRFGASAAFIMWWPLLAGFVAIVFLDLDHWWIPDKITFPSMAWALCFSFFGTGDNGVLDTRTALLGLLPAVMLWGVGAIFKRLTGKDGMGLGDVKLLAVIGLAMGALPTLIVLFLSSFQGAIIGTLVNILGGHRSLAGEQETDAAEDLAQEQPPSSSENPQNQAESAQESLDAQTSTEGSPPSNDPSDDSDAWEPPPRAIPFGPFLVLGCLQLLLLPEIFSGVLDRLLALLIPS